jgi:hypothetical protein
VVIFHGHGPKDIACFPSQHVSASLFLTQVLLGARRKDAKGYSRARLILPAVVLRVACNLAAPAEIAREERLLFRLLLPTPPAAGRTVVVVVRMSIALSSTAVALRLEVWVSYKGQRLQDGASGARRR